MEFEGQLLIQNYRKVNRSQNYTKFEAVFSIEKYLVVMLFFTYLIACIVCIAT